MRVNLKEYFEAILQEKDKAINAAMAAAQKASDKADIATEKRFDGVNEFRGALNDYTKTLATKAELETLKEMMTDLKERLSRMDGRKEGMSTSQGVIVIVATLMLSFGGFLLLLWPHLK